MEITLEHAGRALPLRLTMRRVRLIHELTGYDLLAGGTFPGVALMPAVMYALAGGEAKVGVPLEAFEDDVVPAQLEAFADLFRQVTERDSRSEAGGSGNAPPQSLASVT